MHDAAQFTNNSFDSTNYSYDECVPMQKYMNHAAHVYNTTCAFLQNTNLPLLSPGNVRAQSKFTGQHNDMLNSRSFVRPLCVSDVSSQYILPTSSVHPFMVDAYES